MTQFLQSAEIIRRLSRGCPGKIAKWLAVFGDGNAFARFERFGHPAKLMLKVARGNRLRFLHVVQMSNIRPGFANQ